MTNNEKNSLLSEFRTAHGLAPFKDFRPARHQAMLDEYLAEAAKKLAESSERLAAEKAKKNDKPDFETAKKALADAMQADFAGNKDVQKAAADIAQVRTYKQVAHYSESLVDKPVGFVHQFLSDNPGMTRKQAVIALTEGYGVNYSTARTQYQKWFAAKKAGK